MSKNFLLDLSDTEHQSLKIAVAQASVSMHEFVRNAIAEKIRREQAPGSLLSPESDTKGDDALAQASEKPT
jgi:hypothetical protein